MVVAGAGLAGARAVETLRGEGFEGRVVLIGEEAVRPYERPPLSKSVLLGTSSPGDAFVHSDQWYADSGVELRTTARVTAIDVRDRAVVIDDTERLGYERLLIATGSRARRLRLPGADLPGVHYLRTLADAESLAAALRALPRVVVIGSGWIGTEVAASARALGCDVTLVGRGARPLERVLGAEVAGVYRDLHVDHGVRLLMDSGIECLRGARRVEEVRTVTGHALECDLVVIGVGASPQLEIAQAAGLATNGGIATDERLHTSANWVYAAGDVAAAWHPLLRTRLRLEHWDNAHEQGRVAALNMLGGDTVYDRIPSFFSDQYDFTVEYIGHAPTWDQVVLRGDPAQRDFSAFWVRNGHVVAGMSANGHGSAETTSELIRSDRMVDVAALSDESATIDEIHQVAA